VNSRSRAGQQSTTKTTICTANGCEIHPMRALPRFAVLMAGVITRLLVVMWLGRGVARLSASARPKNGRSRGVAFVRGSDTPSASICLVPPDPGTGRCQPTKRRVGS